MINLLFKLPRRQKRIVSVCADLVFLPLAFWAAMSLRLDQFYNPFVAVPGIEPELQVLRTMLGLSDGLQLKVILVLLFTVSASVLIFIRLGLYRAVIRYMSNHALIAVLTGVSISALVLAASSFVGQTNIPRSVTLIYWCLALLFVGGSRMVIRSIFQHQMMKAKERVIIYGAGSSGLQLSSVLYQGNQFQPVAFIDDSPIRQGSILNGLRVYPPPFLSKTIDRYGANRILLALGETSRAQRSVILRFLEGLPVMVQTIPSMSDILSGKATIAEVRDVEVEDLLGRDEVEPDSALSGSCITDKVVMVTGAGGSIGSELCRQILNHNPKGLVLFEISEYALYALHQELETYVTKNALSVELKAVLGSVQKEHRLEVIMQTFGVQTLYHAAAYKHVPMVEHNIVEGVRNNIFGTWYSAEAAIRAKVETFVLVSTDKAVRPTNVMGASKRMAELVLQALAKRQTGTRFCMVRFGNVLGSSGSVVPLFREQIKAGGPVTVTHKDITRYFMTIPEAAQLVLQAGAMGEGGDVFVLDMGEPVKIADLAKKMIHLMGSEVRDDQHPDGDIEIAYTGLRPGEKLYEELLIGENARGTQHPRIMKAQEKSLAWPDTAALLDELDRACHIFDCDRVRDLLVQAPTDFMPNTDIEDLVWQSTLRLEAAADNISILKTRKKEGFS
ncbi:polysaccharide biosynthesis protein CapD [Oleiphilus messinensis]|uniref:Polysaccharide biosynthesis protein CapD n=1 Tax=Oleiphilus messinensis TaxID=141451 RepID=A0A1Y0I6H3_9GAMM|nr:nucleoside-diphosphate sugar epimerase/dehydratase [Oleiphilus messinensis]ARU56031.1 polysaccharide biosynthesis protein CapD [Oleiphilus messinensis]